MNDTIAERVLVLAPIGRDSKAACALLEQADLSCKPCSGISDLSSELEAGAGVAVIAEEAFFGADPAPLFDWVRNQPSWSDFPFIVLTTRRDDARGHRHTQRILEMLRNVTLQERPVQTVTLVSAASAALRARRRQYEAARYLIEREQAAERLEELVHERTRQLQEANDQLVAARDSLKVALEAAQMITWNLDLVGHADKHRFWRDRLSSNGSLLQRWSRAIAKKQILPDDRELFDTAFRQAMETGNFQLECRIVWPDDSVHWVVAEGHLYRDEQGDPIRLAGTLRDVTERRQVEESLRQTQKLEIIGQLTGGVAHDFNNLLTAVVGNIELAALRTQDEKLLHFLKSAGAAAERGSKLTGQLLAFARRQHLAPRVVSLNELASSMGDLLLQTIGATVRVETVLEKDLWAVMVDPTQLELVILNLAINSRDAMPHGGRLTIATKNIGAFDRGRPAGLPLTDYIAISVGDTGTGMTCEVAAKAFEPFFSTKEVGKGTGLGLSQVHGFARQSGGEVRIDTRPGRGTTISLFLPRTREALSRAFAEAGTQLQDGQAATILVVDDDPDVRELTAQALEALNYQVLEADDGRVALELLRDKDVVDLALVDLVMPGMNGRQLAMRIRAGDPEQKILFMSGYDDLSGTDDPFAREMLLKKPFKLVELAAAVERALGKSNREPTPWNVTPIRSPKTKS